MKIQWKHLRINKQYRKHCRGRSWKKEEKTNEREIEDFTENRDVEYRQRISIHIEVYEKMKLKVKSMK